MAPSLAHRRLSEPLPVLLANTISIDRSGSVRDALGDLADLHSWVHAIGRSLDLTPPDSPDDAVDVAAAQRLIALREAIRRLAAESTADPRTAGQSVVPDAATAVTVINESSALVTLWPELNVSHSVVQSRDMWADGTFVDALTTVVARRTMELVTSQQWDLLRACTAPRCAYYFVKDTARRQWCSAACGNRARVARHAERQRGGVGSGRPTA
jgi:predicted RNA-binding Zn ribbon-like protein